MTPVIILAAIAIVPVILLMLLRINAALVLLSLCVGYVLVQFAGQDVSSLTDLLTSHNTGINTDDNTVKLVLLLLPPVLTMLFMIKTVRTKGKLLVNLLPALGVGALGALVVVPLLPGGLSQNIMDSSIWNQVQPAQGYIVGLSATVSLLAVWMQRPKHPHKEKHGKH